MRYGNSKFDYLASGVHEALCGAVEWVAPRPKPAPAANPAKDFLPLAFRDWTNYKPNPGPLNRYDPGVQRMSDAKRAFETVKRNMEKRGK
jgi:hypothetical protein